RRFTMREAWRKRRPLQRLDPRSAIGRRARRAYLTALGEQRKARHLRTFVRRDRTALREDLGCWAEAGYALVANDLNSDAVDWMADWREREGVQPWMLSNHALALRATGRDAEALEV